MDVKIKSEFGKIYFTCHSLLISNAPLSSMTHSLIAA